MSKSSFAMDELVLVIGMCEERQLTSDLAQGAAGGGAQGGLQDAQRLGLALELGQALGRVAGRDDDLVEHARLAVSRAPELPDLCRKRLIYRPAPHIRE